MPTEMVCRLGLVASVISLAGVVLGALGTVLMTLNYHPFKPGMLVRSLGTLTWQFLRGGRQEVRKHIAAISDLATINEEDRTLSLVGLYILFVSFVIQTLGVALQLARDISCRPS